MARTKGGRKEPGAIATGHKHYGKVIYMGTARGGLFYRNNNGNKVYISQKTALKYGYYKDPRVTKKVTLKATRTNEKKTVAFTHHAPKKRTPLPAPTYKSKNLHIDIKKRNQKAEKAKKTDILEDHPDDVGLDKKTMFQNLWLKWDKDLPPPPQIDDSVFEQKRKETEAEKAKRKGKNKKGYANRKLFDHKL